MFFSRGSTDTHSTLARHSEHIFLKNHQKTPFFQFFIQNICIYPKKSVLLQRKRFGLIFYGLSYLMQQVRAKGGKKCLSDMLLSGLSPISKGQTYITRNGVRQAFIALCFGYSESRKFILHPKHSSIRCRGNMIFSRVPYIYYRARMKYIFGADSVLLFKMYRQCESLE